MHLFSEFPFTVVFLINQNASSVLPCRKELGRTFASFGLGLGQRTGWITPAGRVVAESLPDLSALGPVCSRILPVVSRCLPGASPAGFLGAVCGRESRRRPGECVSRGQRCADGSGSRAWPLWARAGADLCRDCELSFGPGSREPVGGMESSGDKTGLETREKEGQIHSPFPSPPRAAYGGSQTGGQIGVTAAGLHHSHSNARSKPHL